MKWLLFFFLLILVEIAFAQSNDSTFIFTGYVLDEDSIPVENAYLINYRTLRASAVNERGRFFIKAHLGDSVKINHLSFQQKVIYANTLPDSCNVIYLSFEPFTIAPITVKHRNIELEYFNRNMALIFAQMKLNPPLHYQRGAVLNSYAPGGQEPGFGINLEDVIRLFKKKKVIGQ